MIIIAEINFIHNFHNINTSVISELYTYARTHTHTHARARARMHKHTHLLTQSLIYLHSLLLTQLCNYQLIIVFLINFYKPVITARNYLYYY